MTLKRAEIDLGPNIFTKHQAYVALSRVKSIDGLYLRHFDEKSIKVHPRVIEYYNSLDAPELNCNSNKGDVNRNVLQQSKSYNSNGFKQDIQYPTMEEIIDLVKDYESTPRDQKKKRKFEKL